MDFFLVWGRPRRPLPFAPDRLGNNSRVVESIDQLAKRAKADMGLPFDGCKKKLFGHGMIRLCVAVRLG